MIVAAVVPYVPTGSLRLLPRDVQAFEPMLALDGGGVLEEEHGFFDPVHDGILSPDVAEPGLDVVGEIDVGPAAGEEIEEGSELEDDEKHAEEQLEDERQRLEDAPGQLEERGDRRLVEYGAGRYRDEDERNDDHRGEKIRSVGIQDQRDG